MKPDIITNLPSEVIIEILSRLPVPTIIHCKSVCKSLLHLLTTREFVEAHLSKSVLGLLAYKKFICQPILYKIIEFEDRLDLEHHELHYGVTKINLPCEGLGFVEGSANGLLSVWDMGSPNVRFICNPITCEYIKLDCNKEYLHGFGVSKMSCQHKVVRLVDETEISQTQRIPELICQVYTLGTASWRRVEPDAPLRYSSAPYGVFVNGSIHWLVDDLNDSEVILCFDLEMEVFSTLSTPPLSGLENSPPLLCTLGDRLGLFDKSLHQIVIWLMKKYGDEKSWTKEFIINKGPHFSGESYLRIHPLKLFGDGDILMSSPYSVIYYCNKTKTIRKLNIPELDKFDGIQYVFLHTSSFLSLKSFTKEDVRSF